MKKFISMFIVQAFLCFHALSSPELISLKLQNRRGRTFPLQIRQEKGKVISIKGKDLHYIQDFTGGDARIGMSEWGFYDEIPQRLIRGYCQLDEPSKFCQIRIHFSDEEITTIFVYFSMLFQRRGQWITHGTLSETHEDQGMILFKDIYEF